MNGIILAAGGGTRLRPLTDRLPKTLLPVDGGRTILELAVRNFATTGVARITVVTGHAAEAISTVVPELVREYDVELTLRHNPMYDQFNNAYSLWLVRDQFVDGALLVNGDTVHPASVQDTLLAVADPVDGVTLAIDDVKPLADEEMKVGLAEDGRVVRLTKAMPPAEAAGEYIGVARIGAGAAVAVGDSLQATFEADPDRYYEDGLRLFADRGGRLTTVSISPAAWIEVDDHDDLAAARDLTSTW